MQVGICGYSASGKSTVFQALAPGAPVGRGLCRGNVKVPDDRVNRLADIFEPRKLTYAEVNFLDVGGSGGRAGNAFPPETVQHMRNADVLVHVVRAFGRADPSEVEVDLANFNDELVLLDHAIVERRGERFRKELRKGREVEVNSIALEHLESGEPLRTLGLSEDDLGTLQEVQMLTLTPLIALFNLSEETWEDARYAAYRAGGSTDTTSASLGICGELEVEIASLDATDQGEFLEALGLSVPARTTFIQTTYEMLDLISFLTAGPDECRAWPIRRGTVARKAAGKVHSDIERGFIRAEVYRLDDLVELGSEAEIKKAGRLRVEGKEYVVQDGDVVNYRFNV
jgi:GTP-binding protein YchF